MLWNEVSRMRWQAFRQRKLAFWSLWLLGGMFVLALFAESLASHKPILLAYKGSLYTPIFKQYHPRTFGLNGFVMDYKAFDKTLKAGDWSVWPPIHWGPYETDTSLSHYPFKPTAQHWLGVDDKGRDLFVRLLYGFRLSMLFALSVWFFSFAIGIIFGAMQGYFGGKVDFIGQRLSEIWSSVPILFLVLILISVFTPSLWLLVLLFSVFGWTGIAQYQRAEFLKLRQQDFVLSAQALGASTPRILLIHVLPNALTPVVTFTPFTIAGSITGIAALDYLGFGAQPPTPSWGELLRQALAHFSTAWWISFYTVGGMFCVLMLLVFINEGIRAAFDPSQG